MNLERDARVEAPPKSKNYGITLFEVLYITLIGGAFKVGQIVTEEAVKKTTDIVVEWVRARIKRARHRSKRPMYVEICVRDEVGNWIVKAIVIKIATDGPGERTAPEDDMVSESHRPSYWLLGDDQLELGRERRNEHRFAAHFKHALLFNRSLLLSDSMALNNANFRHLVESDAEFRKLIDPHTLTIAVRQDELGEPYDLRALRDRFVEERKSRVPELDTSDAGLSFLQEQTLRKPYSIDLLTQIYSKQSVQLFREDAVREKLPSDLASEVETEAEEARAKLGAGFGLDFFWYRLEPLLKKKRPASDVARYMPLIKAVAQYPYVTALPYAIDVNAVYAHQHAEAFKMCGGRARLLSVGEHEAKSIPIPAGLAALEAGISQLTADDIQLLRVLDEAVEFFKQRDNFDVTNFEESKRSFLVALAGYIRQIQERIVESVGRAHGPDEVLNVEFEIKERVKSGLAKGIDYLPDLFTIVSVGTTVALHLVPPALLSLLFITPVMRAVAHTTLGKTSSEMDRARENLQQLEIANLERRWHNSERLDSEVQFFSSARERLPDETFYTSNSIS